MFKEYQIITTILKRSLQQTAVLNEGPFKDYAPPVADPGGGSRGTGPPPFWATM